MPLIRLDEEKIQEEKPTSVEVQAKKNVQKKQTEKKNKNTKYYPLIYIGMCVVMFGLGLLVIALINLGIGNGFTI